MDSCKNRLGRNGFALALVIKISKRLVNIVELLGSLELSTGELKPDEL